MSRCFRYPPPGYLSNGVRGEAVKDPIKLKRGRENSITELDSKKRNGKKQRKEKKDKKNVKGNKELGYMADTYNLSSKGPPFKGKEEESERSDLTQEHELPTCSLNICHSPDSSGRDNKRKLEHSASISKAGGNILRIRLPLQRHREPDAALKSEGLYSDSGNVESLRQQAETRSVQCLEESCTVTSNSEMDSKSVEDACVADLKAKDNTNKVDSVSLLKKKEHTVDSLYRTLIENWIHPAPEFDQNIVDESWLLGSKEQGAECKRLESSLDDQPSQKGSIPLPCARYLSEADIYALPYSIPF